MKEFFLLFSPFFYTVCCSRLDMAGVVDIPGCVGANQTLCNLMDELLSFGLELHIVVKL